MELKYGIAGESESLQDGHEAYEDEAVVGAAARGEDPELHACSASKAGSPRSPPACAFARPGVKPLSASGRRNISEGRGLYASADDALSWPETLPPRAAAGLVSGASQWRALQFAMVWHPQLTVWELVPGDVPDELWIIPICYHCR